MSLIPEFKIGLLNGWIYSLILLLISHSAFVFAKKMSQFPKLPMLGIILSIIVSIAQYGLFIFTIWLPIVYSGNLFWFGNLMFFPGVIIMIMSMIVYNKAPADKLVTIGIYKISRNPMYLGSFLSMTGIALICGEWLILILIAIQILSTFYIIKQEENYCKDKYGDEYRKYMERVGRFFIWF